MTEVFVDGELVNGIRDVVFNQTPLLGPEIIESKMVREGYLFQFSRKIMVAPLTYFALTHNGLYPLESRHTRGAIEARRDRRRHGAR